MQRCQSLTDAMESVNNRNGWWNLSKLHCTAKQKTGDIPVIGVGCKNKENGGRLVWLHRMQEKSSNARYRRKDRREEKTSSTL